MQGRWFDVLFFASTGKTNVYEVVAKSNITILGYIKWHGAWRKYGFFPEAKTVFEPDCMRDLATCCEELTQKWRQERKEHSG